MLHVDLICLAQDTAQWRPVLNTVNVHLQVLQLSFLALMGYDPLRKDYVLSS